MPSTVPAVETFPAVVKGLSSGEPIGPCVDMSYKVLINLPGGARQVEGIRPACDRWDDMTCRAIRPGTAVFVASVQGQLQLMHAELPHRVSCPQAITLPSGGGGSLVTQFMFALSRATPQELALLAEFLRPLLKDKP